MTLALRYAARSHTGLLRTLNEDSVYAGPRLLAVADGMGGHAAGEVASAVAIAALAPLDEDVPGADLLAALRTAAESANSHLSDMVAADSDLQGMGTTLVAVLFAGGRLGLLHVGDSRAYLLRDGELSQITHDHTLVQTLVDEGRISQEEASSHPQRSMITRALDGRDSVELDLSVREVRIGDRYLLCSDGLTGPVGSLETLSSALATPDPQGAVDLLVQLALKGGGPDNVTVIVADAVDTVDTGSSTSAPVVAGAAAESPQAPPPGTADTPASRARTAEGRDVPAATALGRPDAQRRPRRRRRRTLISLLAVGLLLLVAAGAAFAYIRSQYFVGLDGQDVAVFRGVTGSVAGIPFAAVAERTDLSGAGLSEVDHDRIERGIVAADKADAERIVRALEGQLPGTCPTPGPAPTGAATGPTAIPLASAIRPATVPPAPTAGPPAPTSAPSAPVSCPAR